MDAVRVCLLIAVELQFMGKEDKNCIPRHLVSLVEDFDAWNDYPWGEYMWDKFYKRTVNVVAIHREHHLAEKKKNLNFNATYNLYGFAWAFKIWILESYPNNKIWWSKKENVLPRALVWTNISKFEKSDYNRLFGPVSIPNVDLYSTSVEKRETWFVASIPFINGLVDEDRNAFVVDFVGVSKDNAVDGQHELGYEDEKVNKPLVDEDKNVVGMILWVSQKIMLDGVLDSEGEGRNNEADNVNQPANVSITELFAEVRALRKEVAVIKVDAERIANLERLLKEKLQNDFATEKTKPNMIPNHSNDIPNCSVPDVTSNHTGVDQGLGSSANDPMSTCARPDMHNAEVACDGMSIDKADGKNEYTYSQRNPGNLDVLIEACTYSNKHPELDVFQHDNFVDRSVPKLNQHPTSKPLPDNLTVKESPVEHQPIDELIDGQKDTSLLQENVKDQSNKPKYVKERKKRLAMALDSPFGQQGTTTPAPPKTRSMSSIGDTIVAPEFEENLSRPDGCERDKVTVPDEISEYLRMQDSLEYQFPWGFRDIPVGPIFWLTLACLDKTKEGWLQDSVKGNRRPWWRTMKKPFPQHLTSYLNEHGVLKNKGISVEEYEITYLFPNVVDQANEFGDYGV
ncbi:hypothetical protein Tco_1057634 [Tanacetum coccineum]|uniref:Phospholipase-like protein n=1 Tax=Tanacetum coccineum TaxID=301880 RepID=A0ABQ5H7S1_9ASTR